MPVLGVCLGHQIIGAYFGVNIKVLKTPKHGKVSNIKISKNCKIYNKMNKIFQATRYHSLYLDEKNFPNNLQITGYSTDDKTIMSFKHKFYPLYGVQYHPESIETHEGSTIIENFVNIL